MEQAEKIKFLDERVINKIAAGEVIEHPGSVVKELVENSIDAGASSIRVEVRNGGKDYIKVSDDGEGMNRNDAQLSFQRHTTSKLKEIEDLQNIRTLGFRGEALSSITSVARVVIETKTDVDQIGTKLIIEGGTLQETRDTSGFTGTSIEVRDLFFNVPVRRKYLKSREAELSRVTEVLRNYALIHPEISFRLIHESKEVLFTPKSTGAIESLTYLETISHVLGKSIAREMVPINASTPHFSVVGYISKPNISRRNTSLQYLFVNGRSIKSKLISNALREAYGTLLFPKDHPIVILSFDFDPALIDVNIHPTKREIRFLEEDAVQEFLRDIIQDKLRKMNIIPVIEERLETPVRKASPSPQDVAKVRKSLTLSSVLEESVEDLVSSARRDNKKRDVVEVSEQFSDVKIPKMYFVGQFHNTYLLMQDETNLYMIDQHAAAERITYEKLLTKMKSRPLQMQQLLAPITFELSPKESKLLQATGILERLKHFGFDISHFGGNTFLIRSVPVVFGTNLDEKVILEFLHSLELGKKEFKSDLQDEIIKLMACHSSIRAGEPLSEIQALKLISELRKCKNPYNCPHGRPTIINFSVKFLEKKFKRIV
ncbi:MAG: DNA mismatch repair endonuclease MutL [Candidatus Helarchaeota archaeon]